MNHAANLAGGAATAIMLSDRQMFLLLLSSIALGIILVIATFYEVKYLSEYAELDIVLFIILFIVVRLLKPRATA